MKKLILPILILLTLNLKAQIDTLNQIVIANAGDILESENYILSFTLGEFAIGLFEPAEKMLTQGFHQPDSVDLITVATDEVFGFKNEIIVYPNPSENVINVKIDLAKERDIVIKLFDSLGRILHKENQLIEKGTIELNISAFPKGSYYLVIIDEKYHKKQTNKIIKP